MSLAAEDLIFLGQNFLSLFHLWPISSIPSNLTFTLLFPPPPILKPCGPLSPLLWSWELRRSLQWQESQPTRSRAGCECAHVASFFGGSLLSPTPRLSLFCSHCCSWPVGPPTPSTVLSHLFYCCIFFSALLSFCYRSISGIFFPLSSLVLYLAEGISVSVFIAHFPPSGQPQEGTGVHYSRMKPVLF